MSGPCCASRKWPLTAGCWSPLAPRSKETQDMVSPMTSRQRVLAALKREPVDRTPVCNPTSVATVELMDLVNAPFPDANRQPELMARLAATSYTELGFDSIMPVSSICLLYTSPSPRDS